MALETITLRLSRTRIAVAKVSAHIVGWAYGFGLLTELQCDAAINRIARWVANSMYEVK